MVHINIGEDTIKTLAALVVETAQFCAQNSDKDLSCEGLVSEVLDDGRYRVEIQGAAYTVPSISVSAFGVGDKVLVLFAGGDKKKKYIIGGMGGAPVDNSTVWISKGAEEAISESDRRKLLMDAADNNILKFWDGTQWTPVAIAW